MYEQKARVKYSKQIAKQLFEEIKQEFDEHCSNVINPTISFLEKKGLDEDSIEEAISILGGDIACAQLIFEDEFAEKFEVLVGDILDKARDSFEEALKEILV